MDDVDSKKNPGKDQNHVLEGMRYGRVKFGLRYAYFGNTTAVLLDKMNLYGNRSVELGGMAAYNLLAEGNTMAAHMTCYEHTTKVLGMKATNSFWNPLYYDPLRPTITKQIIYVNDAQVLEEVRALLWLGMTTQRAVIIPNLLGSHVPESGGYYEGRKYWPGFRVAKIKRDEGISVLKVDLLEPAFYWRVQRDYDEPPVPEVLFYDPEIDSLDKIRLTLLSKYASHPRVVLHPLSGYSKNSKRAFSIDAGDQHIVRDLTAQVIKWASDSVGYSEGDYDSTMKSYLQIPSLRNVDRNTAKVSDVLDGVRNCNDIFGRLKGNRTCFQICD